MENFKEKMMLKQIFAWGAAIAQWFRLCLPFGHPGFKFQAHHLRFFQFVWFKLYICHLNWNVKRTKINKKRPGLPHKKQIFACFVSHRVTRWRIFFQYLAI